MANQNDIILDENNDLLILNGDFVVADSMEQEIKCILQAVKNDYKMKPELGVNLIDELNSSNTEASLMQKIKLNLKMDGKENVKFRIVKGEIVFYD